MIARPSQPKRDIFFHSVWSHSVKCRTLRLGLQAYLLLPPICVISHQKKLLILADRDPVMIYMDWKVWEPDGFFSCQASFPLSLAVVVANPVMHWRISTDRSKNNHWAGFSLCWERKTWGVPRASPAALGRALLRNFSPCPSLTAHFHRRRWHYELFMRYLKPKGGFRSI